MDLVEVVGFDLELEFVFINVNNEVVVMLQENNYFVIVDLVIGVVIVSFFVGVVMVENVFVFKVCMSDVFGIIENVLCELDVVVWIDNDCFVIVNEGDYEGGLCGFIIWNKFGDVFYDSGNYMEYLGMFYGYYLVKCVVKKGIELEGVVVGEFGG